MYHSLQAVKAVPKYVTSFLTLWLEKLFAPRLRRSTLRRINVWVSVLVVASMLMSPFAGTPASFSPSVANAAAPAGINVDMPAHPTPTSRLAEPVTDLHLPNLIVNVSVSPRQIAVGDTYTVTVNIYNEAPDPANNMLITLPLPAGSVALSTPVSTPSTPSTILPSFTSSPATTSNPNITASPNATFGPNFSNWSNRTDPALPIFSFKSSKAYNSFSNLSISPTSAPDITASIPPIPTPPSPPSNSSSTVVNPIPSATPTRAQSPVPSGSSVPTSNPSSPAPSSFTPIVNLSPTITPTPIPSSTPTQIPSATATSTLPPTSTPTITPMPTPDPNGWNWQYAQLDGRQAITMSATMRLTQMPPGEAVVVRPSVSAAGIRLPAGGVSGAFVIGNNRGPATVPYIPGTGATLSSQDTHIEVQVPTNAYSQSLSLQHSYQPGSYNSVPHEIAGFKRGIETFYLNATNAQGNQVHQFSAPLTITVKYTPEQLQAAGLDEERLAIFWFDENQSSGGDWVPLTTEINQSTGEASAQVDHFTAFKLAENFSPSEAFLPTLQGWQVNMYTGGVNYEYPIDVPAGPAGIKPQLGLGYSSASSDGPAGMRIKRQAGWVGKDWDLSTGYIALNKMKSNQEHPRHYTMVLNGRSFDLMRGEADPNRPCWPGETCPSPPTLKATNPAHWKWHTTDEQFMKIRAIPHPETGRNGFSYGSGPGDLGRGGFHGGAAQKRYMWQVWTKDGTLYEFGEDAWWGWNTECVEEFTYFEPYKWYVSKVQDTHLNKIKYTYDRSRAWGNANCTSNNIYGTVDADVWPTEIIYGTTGTDTVGQYKVKFTSAYRAGWDSEFDIADNQLNGGTHGPHETQQLDTIEVFSRQSSTWERVRQYNLRYDFINYVRTDRYRCNITPEPPATPSECNNIDFPMGDTEKRLTLKEIERVDKNGQFALPPLAFTYGRDRGTSYYPAGSYNRLKTVNNNQGGIIEFRYHNIGEVASELTSFYMKKLFRNNRRVYEKVVQDGRGNSYTWVYTYFDPAYNSLGTHPNMGHTGPNYWPNSAPLYYSRYWRGDSDPQTDKLARPKETEFRGHSLAIETSPNGNQTEHYFYQGNMGARGKDPLQEQGCAPNPAYAIGMAIVNDSCFNQIRKREVLRGREWKTVSYQGAVNSGVKLSEVEHAFAVPDEVFDYGRLAPNAPDPNGYDYLDERLTGLWRSFSYESQTKETAWDSSSPGLVKYTDYNYETTYGNPSWMAEKDGGGMVLRRTEHAYATRNDATTYIVDRKQWDIIRDGSNNLLAHTIYGYDGSWGAPTLGTTGNLTLVRKYYNLPLQPNFPPGSYSSDASYGYDGYGNQTAVTTYLSNGINWGSPGNGSVGRVTTTEYDSIFHAMPKKVTMPSVGGQAAMNEEAEYDYRMGTMQWVRDYNGQFTHARYDNYGRMVKLWEPGDSEGVPTKQAFYFDRDYLDFGFPYKYQVWEREIAGDVSAYRPTLTFYDGMGREIQTKSESQNGNEHIVVDKFYDGLGQLKRETQPRYVTNAQSFWGWVPPTACTVSCANNQYDGLGRPLSSYPWGEPSHGTSMEYRIKDSLRTVTTTDADGHKKAHQSDMLGRLRKVREYHGTGENDYYATTYNYSLLDLLVSVFDAKGKYTTMAYDSLGRKTSMVDLTMGQWDYTYDPNGNLKTQTDNSIPTRRTTTFNYDALDRLTNKVYWDASSSVYVYDELVAFNGKGRRTKMQKVQAGDLLDWEVSWQYDARGRQTQARYNNGAEIQRYLRWTYDSANRTTSIQYPDNETVNYSYDAAWRQTSVCSNLYNGQCYAQNAKFTPLDQPEKYSLGNGLVERYNYTGDLHRLQQMRVGTESLPSSVYDLTYGYYLAGNVEHITNGRTGRTNQFFYDRLDRLTEWGKSYGASEFYTYDELGNLDTKAGLDFVYNYQQGPGGGGPYALRSTPSGSYGYDGNGNITSMPGRTLNWDPEQQLRSLTSSNGQLEDYGYDADNERAKRVVGGVTTYYFGGLWEEDLQLGNNIATRAYYTLNGKTVAQREVGTHGLKAEYYDNDNFTNLKAGRYDPRVDFAWNLGSPHPAMEGDTFSARWTGRVQAGAATGTYTFQTVSDDGVRLWVNGVKLIDNWTTHPPTTDSATITLNGGQMYDIKLEYFEGSGGATMQLKWQAPGGTMEVIPTSQLYPPLLQGLEGEYYDNDDFTNLKVTRIDGPVDFQWGGDAPSPAIGNDTFSVRWTGSVKTPPDANGSSTYTFQTVSDDGVRLYVNGDQIIERWDDHPPTTDRGSIELRGNEEYNIALEYYERGGGATIQLMWETPYILPDGGEGGGEGGGKETAEIVTIPAASLKPPATETVNKLVYLHGDHLGSVSVVTSESGTVLSESEFDPWGKSLPAASGNAPVTETKRNYTGQLLDDTGLVYMHARYYDPNLGRFVSPDSIVPGMESAKSGAGGTVGAYQNHKLTVDFHESGFVSSLQSENKLVLEKGFWFQLRDEDRREVNDPWGPINPQALNRYAYTLNNPIRYVDPTGNAPAPINPDCTDAFCGCEATYCGEDEIPADPSATYGAMQEMGFGAPVGWLLRLFSRSLVGSGGAAPRLLIARTWQQAEQLVSHALGVAKNTSRYYVQGMKTYRIPDFVDLGKGFIADSKFVQHLKMSDQLRDFAILARSLGVRLDIYVRAGTQVDTSVKMLIASTGGSIIPIFR